MTKMAVSEARWKFGDTLNRVSYGKERIVLQRHGQDVVAMVPIEDLAALETYEDAVDVEEAERRMNDGEPWLDWDEVAKVL